MKKIFEIFNNKVVIFVLLLNLIFWLFFSFSWILFFILVFCVFLFRKASRDIVCDDLKAILSPIDGKVLSINKISHNKLGECLEIFIKNSIYDVGSIRSIANLQVDEIKSVYGLNLNSNLDFVEKYNEKVVIYSTLENKKILFRIHKGSFDYKIKLNNISDNLKAGDEIGFSINGYISIVLPIDSRIHVNIGDEIKACSLLAYIS